MSPRRLRRARAAIAKDPCPSFRLRRHRWLFDGYFWHRCANCGRIS